MCICMHAIMIADQLAYELCLKYNHETMIYQRKAAEALLNLLGHSS